MKLWHIFRGIVEYTVSGDRTGSFLNELRKTVPLRNISVDKNNILHISCFYDGREDFENVAKKYNIEIRRGKQGGIPDFFNRYKARVGLFIGALIVGVFVFVSQFFVWNISVEGNSNVSDQQIKNVLREVGFSEGVLKKRVDISKTVNMFLIKERKISWIAINFDGTVAHVEVREADIAQKQPKKQNVNLVASQDGIIIRVDALEGGTQVSQGDVVHKGQLLVSAYVEGRKKSLYLRGARGFVWAKTQRKYMVCVPMEYSQKLYTGKTRNRYTVKILGKDFSLGTIGPKFSSFDKTISCDNVRIKDKYLLPFEIQTDTEREYEVYKRKRTQDQALEIARNTALSCLKENAVRATVADTQETYEIADDVLCYTCTFECVENIAKELEFEVS